MKCPYCKSENIIKYFNAEMPNIMSACSKELTDKVRIYKIEVCLCLDCMLGFNSTPLKDEELTMIYDDYLYISPRNGIGTSKYIGMLEDINKYFETKDSIVEVGSSEGYLLEQLKKKGYNSLLGFEPGPQADEAIYLGLNVRKEYFTEGTLKGKKVDGFYLMHVFEHFPDPFSILKAMKNQLNEYGKIIIEVPNFTGYHHQHLFYYNTEFIYRLCNDMEMKTIDVKIENGAMRVVLIHKNNNNYQEYRINRNNREYFIELAKQSFKDFNDKVNYIKDTFKESLGQTIAWWGAGSQSVIYLNQLNKSILKTVDLQVIDGDKNKWNNYIPGLNIEVEPFTNLTDSKVDTLIIASSFYKEIQETMKKNNILADEIIVI